MAISRLGAAIRTVTRTIGEKLGLTRVTGASNNPNEPGPKTNDAPNAYQSGSYPRSRYQENSNMRQDQSHSFPRSRQNDLSNVNAGRGRSGINARSHSQDNYSRFRTDYIDNARASRHGPQTYYGATHRYEPNHQTMVSENHIDMSTVPPPDYEGAEELSPAENREAYLNRYEEYANKDDNINIKRAIRAPSGGSMAMDAFLSQISDFASAKESYFVLKQSEQYEKPEYKALIIKSVETQLTANRAKDISAMAAQTAARRNLDNITKQDIDDVQKHREKNSEREYALKQLKNWVMHDSGF